MYVRYHGETPVFVPEDGKTPANATSLAGTMRDTDAVVRKGWVLRLPAHRRADALLRQYLSHRIETTEDKRTRSLYRSFLKAVKAACVDGNPAGVEIAVRKGSKASIYEVYANIHGVGRVLWLPMIVTKSDEKLAAIFRETGPTRTPMFGDDLTAPRADPEEQRVVIPPRIETILVPGKRIG